MSWFKLDSACSDGPKHIAVGDSACWLWARCGMYSAHQLSDGFVPDKVVKRFQEEASDPKALEQCLAIIVPGKGPLLEKVSGGVKMHDYGDFNPTASYVQKLGRVRAEAGRLGNLRRYGKCEQQLPLADANNTCDSQPQASVPPPSSSSKGGSSSEEFRGDVASASRNGHKPREAKPIYPEGKGSGGGEPSTAQPTQHPAEAPRSMLVRVYGQEFEMRCQCKPTAPDSVYDKVGAWFGTSGYNEDKLRYCIGCLIDEKWDLSLLPHKADGYISRRSQDDFEMAPVLDGSDLPGHNEPGPPPGWEPPPGWKIGEDGHAHRVPVGSPLPDGYVWGVDGQVHDNRRPAAPPPKPAPKEKYVLVRDEEKIARMKAQLAEIAKRDAEAKAAAAATTSEAKS